MFTCEHKLCIEISPGKKSTTGRSICDKSLSKINTTSKLKSVSLAFFMYLYVLFYIQNFCFNTANKYI